MAFVFREIKCKIRPAGSFLSLLRVVFPLQHSEQVQNILHHSLAPLSAGLAAGKDVAKFIGCFIEGIKAVAGHLHMFAQTRRAFTKRLQ